MTNASFSVPQPSRAQLPILEKCFPLDLQRGKETQRFISFPISDPPDLFWTTHIGVKQL